MHWRLETCSLWDVSIKWVVTTGNMYGDPNPLLWGAENNIWNCLQQCYFCCLKYIVLALRLEWPSAARNQIYWFFFDHLVKSDQGLMLSSVLSPGCNSKCQMGQEAMPSISGHSWHLNYIYIYIYMYSKLPFPSLPCVQSWFSTDAASSACWSTSPLEA